MRGVGSCPRRLLLSLRVSRGPAARPRCSFTAPKTGERGALERCSAVSPTRWARTRASGPRALLAALRRAPPAFLGRGRAVSRLPKEPRERAIRRPPSRTPVESTRHEVTSERAHDASRRRRPRTFDRPRTEPPRHPRHRRRITGAGFAPPHRLRRSRPSLPPPRSRATPGLRAGCLPPPPCAGPEPLARPTPADRHGQRLLDPRRRVVRDGRPGSGGSAGRGTSGVALLAAAPRRLLRPGSSRLVFRDFRGPLYPTRASVQEENADQCVFSYAQTIHRQTTARAPGFSTGSPQVFHSPRSRTADLAGSIERSMDDNYYRLIRT